LMRFVFFFNFFASSDSEYKKRLSLSRANEESLFL
jgi:hypothetical protein